MMISLDAVRLQLQQPGDGVMRDRIWLAESLRSPAAFAEALMQQAARLSVAPAKSQLGMAFDLYHDAVARHALGPYGSRPAMLYATEGPIVGQKESEPLCAISYGHLHAAAALVADSFRKRGVQAGDILCIIYPLGPELLLALCAALRVGAVVSVLPPQGADFLANRLRALRPQHIVTARRYHPLLKEWYGPQAVPLADALLEEIIIHPQQAEQTMAAAAELESSPATTSLGSRPYGASDALFALFSPQRDPGWIPIAVNASSAYLGALCDGLILGIQPAQFGTVVCAPEHRLLQYQPTLLLLVLLHGGTYLHLDAAQLVSLGSRLPPVDILLVEPLLRDQLLLHRAAPLRGVRSWLCAFTEASDTLNWQDWSAQYELEKTPVRCWHYDAASAGCLLFSLPQRGTPPQLVYPSPGRPFSLCDPQAEDQPARGTNGILRPIPGACGLLLYEHNGGYLYGGTRWPSSGGHSLGATEVEAVTQELPYVAGAVLVPEQSDKGRASFLVFLGPHMRRMTATKRIQVEHKIREQIRQRLGPSFEPNSVRLLAALPRTKDGAIDYGWCAGQHREGQLDKRAQDPALNLIDRLILACHRISTPAGLIAMRAASLRK